MSSRKQMSDLMNSRENSLEVDVAILKVVTYTMQEIILDL